MGGGGVHGSSGRGNAAGHVGGGYAHVPSYSGAYHGGSYWNGNGWHGNGWGWNGHGWVWRGYPYRGWGYPWWGFGYAGWAWYPWGWWNGWDGSYYNSYPSDTYASTYPSYVYVTPGVSEYSQDSQTQDQINSLRSEVDQLRWQQAQSSGGSKSAEVRAQTVLVYRDGHTEEVQNYAIVGKIIWIFNESHARKVLLSQLDLPATKRDNEDRGIDFVIPSSSR
jgi:hypothetical protein